MEDCLFCKIANGEIPATKVYEDESVVAFLDVSPVNFGHTLVIPKKHCEDFISCDDEVLEKMIVVMKRVGQAIIDGLGVEGFNIIQNNGKVASQVVDHLHFHIIPRKPDDGLKNWPQGKYGEGEAEEVAKKIKSAL